MSHLTAERLAELTDVEPTSAEAAHLATCEACRAELGAFDRLRALASDESTRLAPAITTWSGLGPLLRADGLIRDEPATAPSGLAFPRDRAVPGAHRVRWGLRAAAAMFLVAGGTMAGRMSAGAAPLPGTGPLMRDSMRAIASVAARVSDTLPVFRSSAEALAALTVAERQYQYAAAFLGERDSASTPSDDASNVYRARLVALDGVMAATRVALYEAPHDPVINRYYLSTLGARAAAIRQLSTTLPVGMEVSRY